MGASPRQANDRTHFYKDTKIHDYTLSLSKACNPISEFSRHTAGGFTN